jgi:hypothetical protein
MADAYRYPLTRICLRTGSLTLPLNLLGVFPERGDIVALDTQKDAEYTLHVEGRRVFGLGPYFEVHDLTPNDELTIRPLEDGRFAVTAVSRPRRADYLRPDTVGKLVDRIVEHGVPVSEAEIRALHPDLPSGFGLRAALEQDPRLMLFEGRWQARLADARRGDAPRAPASRAPEPRAAAPRREPAPPRAPASPDLTTPQTSDRPDRSTPPSERPSRGSAHDRVNETAARRAAARAKEGSAFGAAAPGRAPGSREGEPRAGRPPSSDRASADAAAFAAATAAADVAADVAAAAAADVAAAAAAAAVADAPSAASGRPLVEPSLGDLAAAEAAASERAASPRPTFDRTSADRARAEREEAARARAEVEAALEAQAAHEAEIMRQVEADELARAVARAAEPAADDFREAAESAIEETRRRTRERLAAHAEDDALASARRQRDERADRRRGDAPEEKSETFSWDQPVIRRLRFPWLRRREEAKPVAAPEPLPLGGDPLKLDRLGDARPVDRSSAAPVRVSPAPRPTLFAADVGLNSASLPPGDPAKTKRAREAFATLGYRVEGLAHGQLMLHADFGRRFERVLVHVLPDDQRLDWAALLARRREAGATHLAVVGDHRDLHRLVAPADLAKSTLWSWSGLDRVLEMAAVMPIGPFDLEAHFERDGLYEYGLDRFERTIAKRVQERGTFSTVLERLALLKAPAVFLLEDVAGSADVPREQALRVLERLAEAPWHLVSRIDSGEFCLRYRVHDALDQIGAYAASLRLRLPERQRDRVRGLPDDIEPIATADVPVHADAPAGARAEADAASAVREPVAVPVARRSGAALRPSGPTRRPPRPADSSPARGLAPRTRPMPTRWTSRWWRRSATADAAEGLVSRRRPRPASAVQVLQRPHPQGNVEHALERRHRPDRRLARREVGDPLVEGPPQRGRVLDVDHEGVVRHRVEVVGLPQGELEAERGEPRRQVVEPGADQPRATRSRQPHVGAQLRLVVGQVGIGRDPHALAGGAHLRPQHRQHVPELREREHGLLDAVEGR